MPRLSVSFFSNILQMNTSMEVILPQRSPEKDNVSPPYQTLYLLHGLSDDHTAWCRKTSIERYAEKYNLAVIMPTTARGFYTNMVQGPDWWDYISEELPEICKDMFHLSDKREDTFAAGLSMGGYGALKLALRKPEIFSYAAGLSGAYICKQLIDERDSRKGLRDRLTNELKDLVFGAELKPEDDIFACLKNTSQSPIKPKLFLCCGTKDHLYEVNKAMKEAAEDFNYDVKWSEAPGVDHTWDYWDKMIEEVLRRLPLKACLRV